MQFAIPVLAIWWNLQYGIDIFIIYSVVQLPVLRKHRDNDKKFWF